MDGASASAAGDANRESGWTNASERESAAPPPRGPNNRRPPRGRGPLRGDDLFAAGAFHRRSSSAPGLWSQATAARPLRGRSRRAFAFAFDVASRLGRRGTRVPLQRFRPLLVLLLAAHAPRVDDRRPRGPRRGLAGDAPPRGSAFAGHREPRVDHRAAGVRPDPEQVPVGAPGGKPRDDARPRGGRVLHPRLRLRRALEDVPRPRLPRVERHVAVRLRGGDAPELAPREARAPRDRRVRRRAREHADAKKRVSLRRRAELPVRRGGRAKGVRDGAVRVPARRAPIPGEGRRLRPGVDAARVTVEGRRLQRQTPGREPGRGGPGEAEDRAPTRRRDGGRAHGGRRAHRAREAPARVHTRRFCRR